MSIRTFAVALLAMTGFALAEPFQAMTVGVPVASIAKAEACQISRAFSPMILVASGINPSWV